MKGYLISFFVALALLLVSSEADATTYYVATTGNNSNPGTNASPWRTIQHAVDSIGPGDTILVKSGTYAGCRIESSGSPNAVCTLKADTGASVLINVPSSAQRHNSNIEIENFDETVRYWVIDGFEVANAGRYGIDLRDTEYITVQNCFVHHSVVTGIFLAFGYHPLIQYNESANNGEHGIYQSNSGDYPIIRANRLHHNVGAGLHMNGDRNFTPGDGVISYALVEKNIVYENGTGGGSGINCDGVNDSLIRNNLLYNNHASGISLYAIDGSQGSSRNQVYNNTIIMASDGRWCVNIGASTEGQSEPVGNKIKNNILYTPHSFRGSISTYENDTPGFESDYNVVVNRFSIDQGGTNRSLAQWQAFGYDLNSIIATPSALFVNPAANDYHLTSGSPAFNTGTALTNVVDDLENIPRPQSTGHDIGCFEITDCSISVVTTSASFARAGGTGMISVVAPPGCSWTATSNSGFISILSGDGGTGNGTIAYSVAENIGTAIRNGTLGVSGVVFTVYQSVDFQDVPPSHPFYTEISKIYARGVTLGCAANLFCPDEFVTREQMAAFIIRSLGMFNPTPPAQQRFVDVPPTNPFYGFIDQLALRQITLGCGGGNYCPGGSVTREQMAAFIIRALGEFNPPVPPLQRFADVPPSNQFYNFIDRMAALNITLGCGGGNYCPSQSVTRGQMAAFLVRAFSL
jgi:hypothetical protein